MALIANPSAHRPEAVALFTRHPVPGESKTRLIPLLGAAGAADFHAALTRDTLRMLDRLSPQVARYVFLAGSKMRPKNDSMGARLHKPERLGMGFGLGTQLPLGRHPVLRQRGADLGERLDFAFRRLLRSHARAVVIGSDSPALPARTLRLALRELRFSEAVLGPCPDGGYYLIGLRRLEPGLFSGVRWGSRFAFRDTLRNLTRAEFCCSILEQLTDVDRPADVKRLAAELQRDSALRRRAPAVWRFLRQRSMISETNE